MKSADTILNYCNSELRKEEEEEEEHVEQQQQRIKKHLSPPNQSWNVVCLRKLIATPTPAQAAKPI